MRRQSPDDALVVTLCMQDNFPPNCSKYRCYFFHKSQAGTLNLNLSLKQRDGTALLDLKSQNVKSTPWAPTLHSIKEFNAARQRLLDKTQDSYMI